MLPQQSHHAIIPTTTASSQRSSGHHASPSTQQACAACKHQRRKCVPNCILAPYFPYDKHHQFLNAHKLFGVSNITKIIKNLGPLEKDEAMKTIIYQSDARAHDPVLGCYAIVHDLQRMIEMCQAEMDLVLRHLNFCRQQEAAAALGCYDIMGSGQVPAADTFLHHDNGHLMFHDIITGQEPAMNHQQEHHGPRGEFNGGFSDATAWAMQDSATSTTASNNAIMASSTTSSPPDQQQQQQMDDNFMNRPSFMGNCIDDIKPLFGFDLSVVDDGDENRHEQIKFVSEETLDNRFLIVLYCLNYLLTLGRKIQKLSEDCHDYSFRKNKLS